MKGDKLHVQPLGEGGQVEATRMGIECARALFDGQLKSSEPVVYMSATQHDYYKRQEARAERAEAAWKAAVEQVNIEQGMKEKAESEAKALREALEGMADMSTSEEMGENADALTFLDWMRAYSEMIDIARAALASALEGKL
jgi:hypothetical protein